VTVTTEPGEALKIAEEENVEGQIRGGGKEENPFREGL